jgi:hypothetical protein
MKLLVGIWMVWGSGFQPSTFQSHCGHFHQHFLCAFAAIFLRLKSSNLKCKHKKASRKTFVQKAMHKVLVKLTLGVKKGLARRKFNFGVQCYYVSFLYPLNYLILSVPQVENHCLKPVLIEHESIRKDLYQNWTLRTH